MIDDPALTAALAYAAAGYAVHWLRPRSKIPLALSWSTLPVATPESLRQTFVPGANVGLRCGVWSQPRPGHGFLVLDIDIRDAQYQDAATDVVERFLPEGVEIPVVLSGSGLGSRHLWFVCPIDFLPTRANITVAQGPSPAERTWKLELLSTGKQVVCPPSVHPETGERYAWAWPDIMPFMPPLVPDTLLLAAHAAQEPPPRPRDIRPPQRQDHSPFSRSITMLRESVADAFRVVPWADILEPHGWQFVGHHGGRDHWVRPGKTPRDGTSATTIEAVFFCFSSSTVFEANTGYSKFAAYAVLNHGGDQSVAAKTLRKLRKI